MSGQFSDEYIEYMGIAMEISNLVKEHTPTPAGMIFYNSFESVKHDVHLLGYVSVIGRAWREIKLDGVLCLDNRPVLYLKEYSRSFTLSERIFFQRLFWNQGVANILVLADPTSVYIYSGLAKPQKERSDKETQESALVEILALADYVQRIQSLYYKLATGRYYEVNRKYFDPDQSVDSWLLNNLRALRDVLIQGNDKLLPQDAHAFIGRVLFLCYLLDRGIVFIEEPGRGRTGTMLLAALLDKISNAERINYLYGLFDSLKDRFNGNMFDQDLDAEKHLIQPSHLNKLILFFGGHNVQSGQRSLGFWPYNFKMIPVETISAIYQDFLAIEDREKQRKSGAFYTPRFLAEMVVDMAMRDSPDAFEWSFLDPACGSGIFLVILFNRLANRWIYIQSGRVHYVTKAKALRDILARQIRGVDKEETACRIACFSLYLAYLDFFDPPDIQHYMERTGRPLPKLLDYGVDPNHPCADIPVIYKADFLAGKTLSGEIFDCIIGNPPWEGRQNKQLAQKFMQEAPRFLQNDGTGCLLLPTKMLQNQTDAFQSEWLQQVTLEKVMQLADYRHLLFQNAKTPAFIAYFKNTPPEPVQHLVEFAAPKFNRDGLRQGIVTVNPSARTWIPLADILAATQSKTAPVAWKRRLWGTPRDQKLLDLLQSLPPLSDLAGTPKEGKRWIKGQGFQPYYPEKAKTNKKYPKPKPNPWELDALFVRAEPYIQMILFESDCTTLGERLEEIRASKNDLRRVPNHNLFKGPMVIVSKGFSKVAYCDFDVLFQDSPKSINGPQEDTDLLMFLTAYLRSSLARYFLFHTSANWGSERNQIHLNELLRVPFPLPGSEFVSTNAGKIVKQVAKKIGQLRNKLYEIFISIKSDIKSHSLFDEDEATIKKEWLQKRKEIVNTLQKELEPLIYRYFGLTEQEITLIEDTIRVFEPSSTPTTRWSPKTVTLNPVHDTTVEPYASQGLSAYADTLTKTLNIWAKTESSRYRVCAEGGTDDQTGLAMVTLTISSLETAYHPKSLSQYLIKVLKKFHEHASKQRGTLHYERDILFFQGDRIHIVRPDILLNWTRTAALNDAARIYGEIVLADKEP